MATATERKFSPRRMVRARRAADLSQADLARDIGKSESNVSKWERGKHEPRGETVAAIARATGKDIEFFYTEADADDDEEEAALRREARDLLATLNDSMVDALRAEISARRNGVSA